MTTTSIIQSTLVKRRPPPIGANAAEPERPRTRSIVKEEL
jgi:hypothetical protein